MARALSKDSYQPGAFELPPWEELVINGIHILLANRNDFDQIECPATSLGAHIGLFCIDVAQIQRDVEIIFVSPSKTTFKLPK